MTISIETHLPWVEKYRPKTLDEVISHHDIIATINRFINNGQLPHLLLHGPPGTGKTSVVQAISRRLYGNDYRQMVLELNASDDRGINVVRETIKSFAETKPNVIGSLTSFVKPIMTTSSHANDRDVEMIEEQSLGATHKPLPAIKLVVLDEADQMTGAAQMALRRIVEKFTSSVRFIIICNYVNKINPALQSRCTKIRFAPLRHDDMSKRTQQIAESEGVQLSDDGLEALVRIAKGDMRLVLNSLESAAMSYENVVIDEQKILETVGLPLPSDLDRILPLLTSQPFKKSLEGLIIAIKSNGYALTDFISALHEKLLLYDLPTPTACLIYPRLAEIQYRLCHGSSETIQMGALVAAFIEIREDLAQTIAQ